MATLCDVTVDANDPDIGVLKILETIKPDWKPATIEKKPLEEGTVNVLFKYWDTSFDDGVVVRVFGEGFSQIVNKEDEVKAYRLLGEIKSSPTLHCLFNNGMCTEFIPGSIFSIVNAGAKEADLKLAKAVAREIAVYHCKKTTCLAVEKFNISQEIKLYGVWDSCLDEWTPNMEDALPLIKSPEFPSKQEILDELAKIKKIISDLSLPLVFCHNDLHPGNSIYDEEKDKATLIDYEFCSFYYAPFDLAFYLFYSMFGLGLDPSPVPPQMHPIKYQNEFLRVYLERMRFLDDWSRDVTDDDVDNLRGQVDVFLLAVMLAHVFVLLVVASNPTGAAESTTAIPWGCLKCWKAYQQERKRVLGY